MISNKWLTLYHYLCRQVTTFPTPQESETALNDKLMFLRAQFLKGTQEPDPQQVDWLEHEAFTLVVSDAIQNLSLTESDLAFLFDTLMAAQLCQLAMVMLNAHKDVMPAPTFHLRCGLVSQKLGDYELATTSFEQALENTPNDASTLCHLGFNALYQDQTEQATLYFEQSIAADPGFAGGYQNLAGLHYQQGDFSQAADFAEKRSKERQPLPLPTSRPSVACWRSAKPWKPTIGSLVRLKTRSPHRSWSGSPGSAPIKMAARKKRWKPSLTTLRTTQTASMCLISAPMCMPNSKCIRNWKPTSTNFAASNLTIPGR